MLPRLFGGSRRRSLVVLVTLGLLQAAVGVGMALGVRGAFDALTAAATQRGPLSPVVFAALLAALAGAAGALRALERAEAERLGQSYANAVRMRLHRRLLSYPPRALQTRSQGGVLLRFIGDAGAVRQWVGLGISRLIVSGLTAVGVLAALAAINAVLAASVALTLAGGALLTGLLGRPLREANVDARRRKANLAATVSRHVSGLAAVQAHGQAHREKTRLARQSRKLRDAAITRARQAGRVQGAVEGTAAMATAVALGLGGMEVAAGRATPGTVAAAIAVVGVLVPALRDVSRVEEYRRSAAIAFAKIGEFLADERRLEDSPGATPLPDGPGKLEFATVTVPDALAYFSAVAIPGSRIGLVGPNGAGKSTLLALACRLADPTDGAVRLDGYDLREHTLVSVRQAVGIVGPDLPLLRGTVEENLRYRWPEAPEHELLRIRALCGIDELLSQLPMGSETRLVDGGVNLSTGQRQRIALARALLGAPRVLVLDEADANLDPVSAAVIDTVLAEFKGTVLFVTHRPERLWTLDAIWHLASGRLVEEGPPAELLSRIGPTRRLFSRMAS